MLKVEPIQMHHGKQSLDTFAVCDESTEKNIALPAEVKFLGLDQRA